MKFSVIFKVSFVDITLHAHDRGLQTEAKAPVRNPHEY